MATVDNGTQVWEYDFACIRLKGLGIDFPIESIKYGIKRENQKGYGNSATITRRTRGRATGDGGQVKMTKEIGQTFKQELVNKYGGILEALFPLSVSYGINGQPVITDELVDVEVDGIDNDHGEGTDGLMETFDISYTPLTSGGLPLFKTPPQ